MIAQISQYDVIDTKILKLNNRRYDIETHDFMNLIISLLISWLCILSALYYLYLYINVINNMKIYKYKRIPIHLNIHSFSNNEILIINMMFRNFFGS